MYYKIEKNSPPPNDRTYKGAKIKWPFCLMELGDRVTIEKIEEWRGAVRAAHATASNSCGKKKFRCRWIESFGHVWRIK